VKVPPRSIAMRMPRWSCCGGCVDAMMGVWWLCEGMGIWVMQCKGRKV
jgi:hypothetical protein